MDNQLSARILSRLVKFRDEVVKEDMIVPPWVIDSIEEIEAAQHSVQSDLPVCTCNFQISHDTLLVDLNCPVHGSASR